MRRRLHDETGAGLVEFALVLPVLAMLLVGMISAGVAYQRSISLSQGARESARHGATLPVTGYATLDEWLDAVGERAIADAGGELEPGVPGRRICVAFVHPDGTATTPRDRTRSKTVTGSGTFAGTASTTTPCFTDGRPSNERRVQISVRRTTGFDAVLFSRTITLSSDATARYEAFVATP